MRDLVFKFGKREIGSRISFVDRVEEIEPEADMVITDSRVDDLFRSKLSLREKVLRIPGGEISKTPETLNSIWREMAAAGLRRDSVVCVIGGGTVCDIGAFAVSTWKRGMKLILVPTTLLCMVDACLGGKTAVNIDSEKNQAGTFHPAEEILVCSGFLETLPPREMLNGVSEALKTAVIGNRAIVDLLKEKDYIKAVEECLKIKGGIVTCDLEESGERKLLNLGHTIGHCIETASEFRVSHGQSVAMGIPAAARMAGNDLFAQEFVSTAEELGLDTCIPGDLAVEDILNHLSSDKKTSASGRTWIIPDNWEKCRQLLLDPVEEALLLKRSWR